MPNIETTWNYWEWSELYALGFILSNNGIFWADELENKRNDLFYQVLEVYLRDEWRWDLVYQIKWNEVDIFIQDEKLKTVKIDAIKPVVSRMFGNLTRKNKGRAFTIENGIEMMEVLERGKIKAKSSDKKDIEMTIVDIGLKTPTPKIGFSIKSQLWSPATLVNSSMATNFIYEVLDKDWRIPKTFPTLHPKKVKDNVMLLKSKGYKFNFSKIQSATFDENLWMIDSKLGEHLSTIVLSYYSKEFGKKNSTSLQDLTEWCFPQSITTNKQPLHKIKEFLGIMALWMMPDTPWDWILTTLWGFLLVKKNWDVLCYYLYNFWDFQNFLFRSTKLDTPSTSRSEIGSIYEENGHFYMRLNLQVRFRK